MMHQLREAIHSHNSDRPARNDARPIWIRLRFLSLFTLLAVVHLSMTSAADASWIRPRGFVQPAGLIDPIFQSVPPNPLIPTIANSQFNDGQKGFFSEADLGNGALRARAFVNGGSGNANANPIYGETITFNNSTGGVSSWDFEFSIDGTVETGSPGFPVEQTFGSNTFRTTFIQFAFHVFEGGTVGPQGSANDWTTKLGDALFSEVKNIDGFPLTGTVDGLDEFLTDSITGSIPLAIGSNSFDIVAVMAVGGSIPSTFDSSFDFNFTNTAALEIDSVVDFESDSGVFLTGTNVGAVVPEPSTFALLALGGVALAGYGWRRKRQMAA